MPFASKEQEQKRENRGSCWTAAVVSLMLSMWMRDDARHRPTASQSRRQSLPSHPHLTHTKFSIQHPGPAGVPLAANQASCSCPPCAHRRGFLAGTTPVTIALICSVQAVANARHRLRLVSGPVHHSLRGSCARLTGQDYFATASLCKD